MRSGRPAACATRMATSGPFSGSMRPRNARYSSDRLVNGRSVSGSPWWMVASQLISGAGVRWLGDRDERGIWKSLAHKLNVWQVEAAMQGGEKRYPQAPQEW